MTSELKIANALRKISSFLSDDPARPIDTHDLGLALRSIAYELDGQDDPWDDRVELTSTPDSFAISEQTLLAIHILRRILASHLDQMIKRKEGFALNCQEIGELRDLLEEIVIPAPPAGPTIEERAKRWEK